MYPEVQANLKRFIAEDLAKLKDASKLEKQWIRERVHVRNCILQALEKDQVIE